MSEHTARGRPVLRICFYKIGMEKFVVKVVPGQPIIIVAGIVFYLVLYSSVAGKSRTATFIVRSSYRYTYGNNGLGDGLS